MSNEILKSDNSFKLLSIIISGYIYSTLCMNSLTAIKVTLLEKVHVTYLEEVIKSTDTRDLNSYTE